MKVVRLSEALNKLKESWKPRLKVERLPLREALGRVLAVDVESPIDLPPFNRSAVDGYAVKAQDTYGADEENPARLKLAFKVPIGTMPTGEVREGECAYVTTGSALPRGADAVVMVEYTHQKDEMVEVYRAVVPGENVVLKGSEAKKGAKLLRKGSKLSPSKLGLLAAIGLSQVEVYAKPKVAVISTGPELVEPGKPLEEGKAYDVNTTTISAMVEEEGGEAEVMGLVPDNLDELRAKLSEALNKADLVLTSGGTSKGESDLLPKAVAELPGSNIIAHGLALKPGKPTLIALVGDKPVIGLPGNPTSAMLVFKVLVRPLIRTILGLAAEERAEKVRAKASVRMTSVKGRREFKFGLLEKHNGELYFKPLTTGSEAVATYALADGYVEIPEEVELLDEGEEVEVELLKGSVSLDNNIS